EIKNFTVEAEEISHTKKLIDLNPNQPSLWLKYCEFFLNQKDYVNANKVLLEALNRIDAKKIKYRITIMKALLNIYLDQNYDDFKILEFLIKSKKDLNKADMLIHALNAAENMNKFEIGLKIADLIVKTCRNDTDTLKQVIIFYSKFYNQNEDCKKSLDNFLSLLPNYIPHQNAKIEIKVCTARNLCQNNSFNKGVEIFESLIYDYPKHEEITIAYLLTLIDLKKVQSALPVLKRFISKKPKKHGLKVLKTKIANKNAKSLSKLIDSFLTQDE
ncbi:MAG: hypothetical protein MHPSP_003608, partial [Paramarteilia canceri]